MFYNVYCLVKNIFKYINKPDMPEEVHLIWMTRSTATASICLAQDRMTGARTHDPSHCSPAHCSPAH